MEQTADVVIIGGGIVGASVAFHLAERGCTDVLVVERAAEQGSGSTGKATGGVRAQFATAGTPAATNRQVISSSRQRKRSSIT
jgi:sarcosine oxidase subunit beta